LNNEYGNTSHLKKSKQIEIGKCNKASTQFHSNVIFTSTVVLTATSQNYSGKVLKILRTFFVKTKTFFSRPRPRLWVPRPRLYFCPRGASRPRPWSRGLHHCV